MLIRASAFAMLAFIGSAASAQTTNCHWVGQTWTCDTRQGTTLDPNIIGDAFGEQRERSSIGDLIEQRARIEAQEEQTRAQQKAQQRQDEAYRQQQDAEARDLAGRQQRDALWQRIGQMVAGGDCVGAQSAALAAGDFELANQVKSYCAS